jgi:hypothetical protein
VKSIPQPLNPTANPPNTFHEPPRSFQLATGQLLVNWPIGFVSRGRELTGVEVDLKQVYRFPNHYQREGYSATIYRLRTGELDSPACRQQLSRYPMWCGLALDGYKRVRWQTLDELRRGPDRILAERVFNDDVEPIDLGTTDDFGDIHGFAIKLAKQDDDVMIAAWYSNSGGIVTNYFIYILDLRRQVLVQLALTT